MSVSLCVHKGALLNLVFFRLHTVETEVLLEELLLFQGVSGGLSVAAHSCNFLKMTLFLELSNHSVSSTSV